MFKITSKVQAFTRRRLFSTIEIAATVEPTIEGGFQDIKKQFQELKKDLEEECLQNSTQLPKDVLD